MAKKKIAKSHRAKKKVGGPFLASAFFCNATIEDKQDSAITAVRIIDSVTILIDPSAPDDVPSESKRLPVQLAGLLSFKSGDSPGMHSIRIVAESPSGKKSTVMDQEVEFSEPPHGGINMRINQVVAIKQGGLFWFHVFLDRKRVTSMPLMISVQRAEPEIDQADAGQRNHKP